MCSSVLSVRSTPYDDWDLMTIIRSKHAVVIVSLFHGHENASGFYVYSISHMLGIMKLKNINVRSSFP